MKATILAAQPNSYLHVFTVNIFQIDGSARDQGECSICRLFYTLQVPPLCCYVMHP